MAYRSQLLNRFVEGFFGDTNDNGIVISNYLPITFAENWTYSRALYKDNKNYTHVTGIYFHFLKHYSFLGGNERIASTCNPDNDVWLKTRSATSCALFPLILAVTCQIKHDNFKHRRKGKIDDYKSHSNNSPWTDRRPSDVPPVFQESHELCLKHLSFESKTFGWQEEQPKKHYLCGKKASDIEKT